MLFTVGPYRYSVRIAASATELEDKLGLPASADIDYEQLIVTIAQRFPLERRIDELCYCLSLIWDRHFGTPDSATARAAQRATFAIDFWRQIERQGGVSALVQLDGSGARVRVSEDRPVAFGTECPKCGGKIGEGDIDDSPRMQLGYNGPYVVRREAGCEHCDIKFSWLEHINSIGRPTGELASHPKISARHVR